MNKREVVKLAIKGRKVPYVPWHCGFTVEAAEKLRKHFGQNDLEEVLDNHFVKLGSDIGFFTALGNERFRDVFGVVWDRTVDKDIGIVEGCVLPQPTLQVYELPDPRAPLFFEDIPEKIFRYKDCFRVFKIGFSLYERAWTLRGMENLMMDFLDHPDFVRGLLRAIADYNIAQIKESLKYDIDAVYFGDDWGQQRGLQMGPRIWRQFILPELRRMYSVVRQAGKHVMIHSCGKVDELFDDLIAIGVNCFNPFQPEVMNIYDLMKRYKGRLAFHGGLSTQQTLPYGSVEDVGKEVANLLEAGKGGGYIFAPAHAVEGDVPLENMLVFVEMLHSQPGYKRL
jgi:uroporphyrinogen decarboxylase